MRGPGSIAVAGDLRLPPRHVRSGRGAVGAGVALPAAGIPSTPARPSRSSAHADAGLHLVGGQPGRRQQRAVRPGDRRRRRVLARRRGVCAVALLAAALTKPSGLQLAAVLRWSPRVGAVRLVDVAARPRAPRRRLVGVARRLLRLAPPRFLATGPSNDTLGSISARWAKLTTCGARYWGQLGWLDYSAPSGWYERSWRCARQPRVPRLAATPAAAPAGTSATSGSCSCVDVRRRVPLPARGRLHVPGPLSLARRPRPGRRAAARGARRARRAHRPRDRPEPGAGARDRAATTSMAGPAPCTRCPSAAPDGSLPDAIGIEERRRRSCREPQ